jgi:predicted Zn-dependent peptidase
MTSRHIRRSSSRLLATFVLALVTAQPSSAQQPAPDRTHPPAIGPAPALHLPPIEKRQLSNGLTVWVASVHKVPVVQVTLVVRAAAADEPPGKFGLASLTADMLDEGAGDRSALQIADAVDYLGAQLSAGATFDATLVNLHVPVARLADAVPILADVVLRPTFPEADLKRVREERLTSLVQAADDPESLVDLAFPRIVYGQHRYGTSVIGTAASLRGFTRDDLVDFHRRYYVPGNAALFVAGDLTADAAVAALERGFGGWRGAMPPATTIAPPPQVRARQVFLVDKPGAAQSQIRIGWVGVPRSTRDYFALRVLNTILGGSFTSRLNENLREAHGYAYGASSAFDMRLGAGPFEAAAGVQTDKTAAAVTEFFNELQRIRQPVDAAELEKAKRYLSLLLPRSFETTRGTTMALAQMFVYGLPNDFYETFAARVGAVTAADVKRAADEYIQPDRFDVVIVGDRSAIEPGLRSLNLGPLTIVPAADILK